MMMQPCEIVTFISAISCVIAKDKTSDEIEELSVIFSQLGDTLATIAVSMDRNKANDAD